MPLIDVRDTRLYYEQSGSGEQTLLFVHGMCGGAWSWDGQVKRLASEFTCIAYDRRGHSRSEQGTEDQSDRTHAEDLAALIDVLGLDRPILIASSGGAVVALEFLHRFPNVVQGAMLNEPPLFSVNPETGQRLMAELAPKIDAALADNGPRAAVDAFYQVVCGSYWSQADDARKKLTLDNAPVLMPTLERDATKITAKDLEAIDVPVLVIGGADSPSIFRDLNATVTAHLSDARFVEIQGSAHVVYAEQPDQFAHAVRGFAHEVAGVASPTA